MHAGERPRRSAVVELSSGPLRRRMAKGTVLRETRVHVIRIRGLLVVSQVTGSTCGGSAGVLSVDVALSTRNAHVGSGKRELGEAMVHRRRYPAHRGMAAVTGLGQPGSLVVRVRRAVVIVYVTGGASRTQSGVHPARMARGAGLRHVQAGQRELRERGVIELDSRPRIGSVADGTLLRETRFHVVRTTGGGEVLSVTTVAIRLRVLETTAGVAGRAVQLRVRAAESKARHCGVIKFGARPTVHAVAGLAGGWEIGRFVVGQRSARIIGRVATDAIDR